MADKDIPECGDDCYVIEYEKRPGVAVTYRFSDTERYPMPVEGDGYYGFAFFPGMRDAFAAEAQREMDKYKSYGKGCSAGCTCEKDEGAAPRSSGWWQVPVSAPYTFPDGSQTIAVVGYFEIRQHKTVGTCRPLPRRTALIAGLPKPLAELVPLGEWAEQPKPAAG